MPFCQQSYGVKQHSGQAGYAMPCQQLHGVKLHGGCLQCNVAWLAMLCSLPAMLCCLPAMLCSLQCLTACNAVLTSNAVQLACNAMLGWHYCAACYAATLCYLLCLQGLQSCACQQCYAVYQQGLLLARLCCLQCCAACNAMQLVCNAMQLAMLFTVQLACCLLCILLYNAMLLALLAMLQRHVTSFACYAVAMLC